LSREATALPDTVEKPVPRTAQRPAQPNQHSERAAKNPGLDPLQVARYQARDTRPAPRYQACPFLCLVPFFAWSMIHGSRWSRGLALSMGPSICCPFIWSLGTIAGPGSKWGPRERSIDRRPAL
jgi:hypothetical protein